MESLKRFVLSAAMFMSALAFPLNTVLAAEEQLIDTIPDGFYYLEDTENASFLVHACGSQSEFHSESLVFGMKCGVVAEIDKSHLEEFMDEIESRQVVSGKSTKFKIAGGITWAAAVVMGIKALRKGNPTGAYATFITIIGIGGVGVFIYGDSLGKSDKRVQRYYTEFESQIRSGIVGRGERIRIPFSDYDSNRGMMKDFTDFLNEYGVPFEADSPESD